jgi:folate-dependent phosphoribosylglycinamide formyltransferase PurN
VTRYPRVDTVAWKRELGERLLAMGMELAILSTRASLADQVRGGFKDYALGIGRRFVEARRGSSVVGTKGAPTLGGWARERGLAVSEHHRLADSETLAVLRAMAPDLLILAGADIIPTSVLSTPRCATINPHYGLLPRYRGMSATEWSIWHDDPVAVTVDAGVDTGDILLLEAIAVREGDTLETIRAEQQRTAARLLADAARIFLDGEPERTPQLADAGRQHYRMHPELQRQVEERLARGEYRWIGDPRPPLALAPTTPT